MNQPGKVANPSRGQLNRENEYSPVPVREFGVCVYFIKLHITAQSGPVILVIIYHSH